ncbi:hypothetical protein Rs2_35736 [Raphanus sativus]|nr:hypothetical protein Rs2_35736 [Raphanus sativus]
MPQPLSINDVLPHETELYCIVDASWKSPSEKIGIGWSLFSKEGTLRLQGSSAMEATDTPLVAEAVAMWEAVCQLHRLCYKNVTFLGDSLELIRQLDAVTGALQKKNDKITEAASIIHDIKVIAVIDCFSFRYVPRSFVHVVDTMAKKASMDHQSYVISWPPY